MVCGKHIEADLCRVVKNTFIELPVASTSPTGLRRSQSDSALYLRTRASPTIALSEEVLDSCRSIAGNRTSTPSSKGLRARWSDDLSDDESGPPLELQLHRLLPEPECDPMRFEQQANDFAAECTGMLPMVPCPDFQEVLASMIKNNTDMGYYSMCSTPEACDDAMWAALPSDFSSRTEDSEEEREVQSGTVLLGSSAPAAAADDAAPGATGGAFAEAWQLSGASLNQWSLEPKENPTSSDAIEDAFNNACAAAEQHQMSMEGADTLQWLYEANLWAASQGWDEMSAGGATAWY